MTKKRMLILLSINILCVVLTIVSVAWGTRFDWPDNVHVDYGFPFVWSTNTLSTISGAANIWIVNIAVLLLNIGFWLGIMLFADLFLLVFLAKN